MARDAGLMAVKPGTVGELKDSGYSPRSVKREIRDKNVKVFRVDAFKIQIRACDR